MRIEWIILAAAAAAVCDPTALALTTVTGKDYATIFGMGQYSLKPCFDALLARYRMERSGFDVVSTYYATGPLAPILNEGTASGFPFDHNNGTPPVTFGTFGGRMASNYIKQYPFIGIIPIFASPVVIIHSLPNTPLLKLTREQFVGVFNRTISNWGQTALRAAGMNLPTTDDSISVWVRKEPNPSTWLMKKLMLRHGMALGLDSSDCEPRCNVFQGWADYSQYSAAISPYGIIGGVATRPNSIGYTGYVDYMTNCVDADICRMTSIPNDAGKFVKVSPQTMEETVKSLKFDEHLQTELANESNAYPMNNIIQMVVRATGPNSSLPNDCKNQIETIRFARWIFYNSSAHEIVRGYHYFPLTSDTYDAISEHLSKTLKCGSSNESFVWTMMMAKIAAENETVNLGLILGTLFGFWLVGLTAWGFGLLVLRHMKLIQSAERQIYVIREEHIKIIKASREKYHSMMHFRKYLEGRYSLPVFVVGEYKADVVMLLRTDLMLTKIQQKSLRIRLVEMIIQIRHPNVVRFYGLTEHSAFKSSCFAISQFCPLGDLRTALDNKRNELDAPIKFGMARGITEGLTYLHENNIVHGNLRSSVIFLEADWTTRISDWQTTEIDLHMNKFRNRERIWRQDLSVAEETIFLPALLWSAPEILTATAKDETCFPTKESDVYSFSIILFEILTRDHPYEYHNVPNSMSFEQLFAMIKRNIRPMRPLDFKEVDQFSLEIPQSVIHVMKAAWSAEPVDRPKITEIRDILRAVSSEMKRLADLTIVNTRTQIEQYKRKIIKNSEETVELVKELARTEADFLTHWVYDAEQDGGVIEPKFHQVVYALHCSLVNYEGLCAVAHGDAVLYFTGRFCHIVDQVLPPDRNIHRLHSNGDDVTIVAAIPTGGVEYAAKMASLALDLLAGTWKADLLDIDWDRMEVRIGLGCGPAVAGIYGNNHRGFTVVGMAHDEAVLVESVSASYRILLTEAFYEALKIYPDFTTQENLDERYGIAGKKTYWLTGQERYKYQKLLDDIERIYPPLVDGFLPNVEKAAQSRVRIKQKQTKMSVQAPVGFYIQKDVRSGYIVEHYPDRHWETSLLPTIREQENGDQLFRTHQHHHLPASHSQSKMFGSMLGPQGFGTYKDQYAVQRRNRKTLDDCGELRSFDETLFLGQLGYNRNGLPTQGHSVGNATLDDEVPTSPETDFMAPLEDTELTSAPQAEIKDSPGMPLVEDEAGLLTPLVNLQKSLEALPVIHLDFLPSIDRPGLPNQDVTPTDLESGLRLVGDEETLVKDSEEIPMSTNPASSKISHRKHLWRDREQKQPLAEVLRKTSEWVNQLPDPSESEIGIDMDQAEEAREERRRRKSSKRRRRRKGEEKGEAIPNAEP